MKIKRFKEAYGKNPWDPWSAKAGLDETSAAQLDKFLMSRGINPKYVAKDTKIAHSKSNQFKQWAAVHATEEVQEQMTPAHQRQHDIKKKIHTRSMEIKTPRGPGSHHEEVKEPTGDLKKACWKGYVAVGTKKKAGRTVPNCVPAAKADDLWEDSDDVVYETDSVMKADGYSPPAGARAAARKAIKFKEDGKAGGAGTSVGWTRARQLANGETLSLSTVKRMYSYFSRHEVDKKGKDWGSQSNPSNGYIMWLAWGGDAGYSWSRSIVNAEKDKKMFSNIFSVIDKTNKNTRGSGNVFWSI